MRAAFFTLGCKVNQYETNVLMQHFFSRGYDIVGQDDPADVYIINSCTVTAAGDKKTRQLLRRLKRTRPDAILALTGCFPQAFPDEASVLPEADVITGSYNRASLPEAVLRHISTGQRVVDITAHTSDEPFESMSVSGFDEHTRAFVKIQDGCFSYCSYCIIPSARGPVRSKPLPELKDELIALCAAGYREVVLVGINLCSYGMDTGASLYDAVLTACTTSGIDRVRLGSLEPQQLSPEDIERLSKLDGLCPHFHMSLQSGCDETLERMNRQYDTAHYMELVQSIRKYFDNPAVTTDIMVGFPGETPEEFAKSMKFVRSVGFARAHIFPYSPRPGTDAALMGNQVPRSESIKRAHEMTALAKELEESFLRSQIGRRAQVLFETRSDGALMGYTPNYTYVRAGPGDRAQPGDIGEVEITGAEADICVGRITGQNNQRGEL